MTSVDAPRRKSEPVDNRIGVRKGKYVERRTRKALGLKPAYGGPGLPGCRRCRASGKSRKASAGVTSAAACLFLAAGKEVGMRTLHWSDRGRPEPRAPSARPVRHVRFLDTFLPHGHPRRHSTPPPALAATARPGGHVAEVTFGDTPLAHGAINGRLQPSLAGNI